MSSDLSPSSRCVFYLLSLYIANLSSENFTVFLRFQEFDDPLPYSNLIVPRENVYADFGVSNACSRRRLELQDRFRKQKGSFPPETCLMPQISKDQLQKLRAEEAGSVYCISLAVYLIKRRAWGEDVGCKFMHLYCLLFLCL